MSLDRTKMKIIAYWAMLFDHFAVFILARYVYPLSVCNGIEIENQTALKMMYIVFRCIGRISFPIFAYLAVEGMEKTSSKKKYFTRLGVLAVITEGFYDVAMCNCYISIEHQNVIFELFMGLVAIELLRFWQSKNDGKLFIVEVIICFAAMVIAEKCNLDYGYAGILFMLFIFLFDNKKMGCFVGCMVLVYSMKYEFCAFLAEYSDANEHSFRKFRAPLSGKTVHVFPEVSAMSIVN